jgi:hypothetical protein
MSDGLEAEEEERAFSVSRSSIKQRKSSPGRRCFPIIYATLSFLARRLEHVVPVLCLRYLKDPTAPFCALSVRYAFIVYPQTHLIAHINALCSLFRSTVCPRQTLTSTKMSYHIEIVVALVVVDVRRGKWRVRDFIFLLSDVARK